MKPKLTAYRLPGAIAALAALLTFAPAILAQQQPYCYPSYRTLSGTCPDSCGRGDDCPCLTCVEPIHQT
jgi:hypothetical protein